MADPKRVALLGFSLESNGHAPIATEAEFKAYMWLEGEAFGRDMRAAAPESPPEVTGFLKEMDRRFPGLGEHLEEETTVAIDGEIHDVGYYQPVGPSAEVFFIPKLEGG